MKNIIVETSARHMHLNQEALDTLCGKGATLENLKDLSQPGQYVSNIKICIEGVKGRINNVTVLGPLRKEVQVEVSLTDARTLGCKPCICGSGNLCDGCEIKLIGPCGELIVKGLIAAQRHIHMTNKDAEEFGVSNGDLVNVKIDTKCRKAILGDVLVRVSDTYALAMHIDTDEANAINACGVVFGEIVK